MAQGSVLQTAVISTAWRQFDSNTLTRKEFKRFCHLLKTLETRAFQTNTNINQHWLNKHQDVVSDTPELVEQNRDRFF